MTCWLVAHAASSRAPCGRGDPLKKLASRLPRRQKKAPRNDLVSAKACMLKVASASRRDDAVCITR